jgi:thiol reductant ABC exporter CydC subunit
MRIFKSQLLQVIKPFQTKLLLAGLLSGTSLFMAVGLLAASAWLISMASTRPPILTLQVAIVAVRFFGLGRGVFRYASRLLEHDAALAIQGAIRQELYKNLEKFTPSQFANLKRGQLLRQSVTQTEEIQDIWLRTFLPWFSAIIAATSGISIIAFLLPQAAISIGAIFLVALVGLSFIAAFSSARVKYRDHSDKLFDQIMQSCDSSQESQIFGFNNNLQSQISLVQTQLDLIDIKESKSVGIASALHSLFMGAAVMTGGIYAASAFIAGDLSGVNVAVITLLPLAIFDNLNSIPSAFSKVRQHFDSARSIEQLLTSAGQPKTSNQELGTFNQIIFENTLPLLPGANVSQISAKCFIDQPLVIMGASGSGKSSLINCLLGFLPYEGSIKIDGVEARDVSPESINSNITVLLQNDYLFNSSIRENLRIANQSASDEQLLAALDEVELRDLITSLPKGLDTHIGAYGFNFSGGEKQRIRLARILLRNTPVYLLDEPFEFLDSKQANRISNLLLKKLKNKVVVIISHLEIEGVENVVNFSKR